VVHTQHGREVYLVVYAGYVPPYVPWCICRVCTPYTPWVYHGLPAHGVLPGTLSPAGLVYSEEALGSNLGIIREIRDMRRIELSIL